MPRLQFDNKISLGHLLTALVLIIGIIGSYYDLSSSQKNLAAEIARRGSEISTIETAAQSRESRLRAVELLQAGQVSDLRNIQSGISRIETQLDRLMRERP